MMTELSYLFMTTAALAGLLAMISVWSRHRSWIRAGALAVAFLFLPLAYVSYASLLSKPKPVSLEWWMGEAEEATVLSSSIQEEVGIFPLAAAGRSLRAPGLCPSLEPRSRRAAAAGGARGRGAGRAAADAPAVRAVARRARTEVLRHAAARSAAQGPEPSAAGNDTSRQDAASSTPRWNVHIIVV